MKKKNMTAFALIIDFIQNYCPYLKDELYNIVATQLNVSTEAVKNWLKRRFPKIVNKSDVYNALINNLLINEKGWDKDYIAYLFIKYLSESGYYVNIPYENAKTDLQSFIEEFIGSDLLTKTIINNPTTDLINPYDAVFAVLNCVMSTSLPDYSSLTNEDTKYCSVSRATLVSLVKHCMNINIDNELSEEYSAIGLNEVVQNSNIDFIKELNKFGYSFEDKDGLVILKKPESTVCRRQIEYTDDELLRILKTLHDAYKSYEIHEYFSSKKKIELNCTVSLFTNALAFRGIFNSIERKRYLCELIESLISTHNHDCNFIYPILSTIEKNKKRPPLVEVGVEQTVKFVCDYCCDVFNTDNNPLIFIPNFIETLRYYKITQSERVGILTELIYNKKAYDLRLIEALVSTDPSQINIIRGHFESGVFSLIGNPLTEDVKRVLIAFICMFGRGSFDKLISHNALTTQHFLELLSSTIHYIVQRFDNIVPYGHIRRKDVAQGLAKVLMIIRKNNEELSKKALENIDITKFNDHALFVDTYNFIFYNKISVTCARLFFSTPADFFAYVEENLICSKNPFLTEKNPLLIYALNKIRFVAKNKNPELTYKLKAFADDLLFWMIEAAEADLSQNCYSQYLGLLTFYSSCICGNRGIEYRANKTELFVKILKKQNENPDVVLIPAHFYQKIWDAFNREKKCELNDELNKCIETIFLIGREFDEIDFLFSNFRFVNNKNKEMIKNHIDNLINSQSVLTSLSSPILYQIFFFVEDNKDESTLNKKKKLLISLPHMNTKLVSSYDVFNLCYKYMHKNICEEIAKSLISGNGEFRELIDFLIATRFRSWQRACLKNLLSSLLNPGTFFKLDLPLQINMIHYVKDKQEYYDDLKDLMDYLSNNDNITFDGLDTKLKTALTIHCHNYIDLKDPKNACFLGFLDYALDYLTENAYTHLDVRKRFGIRTDTLIFHILETFKCQPTRTAIICLYSICKLNKQLSILSTDDAWNSYRARLLIDRVRLFKTVVANPCIKNAASYYVREMYRVINSAQNEYSQNFDSHLKMLKELLVSIVKDNRWPNWFNIPRENIIIQKEDTIQTNVCIDKDLFIIEKNADSNAPNDKAKEALRKWREKLDVASPLQPEKNSEVVALHIGDGYIPISGWGVVFECLETEVDFYPSSIITTVISLADVAPILFDEKTDKCLDYEDLIKSFNDLFTKICDLIPQNVKIVKTSKRGEEIYERIYVKNVHNTISNSVYLKLAAFLEFYYKNIYIKPKIREYVLAPYYDYYVDVTKDVLKKLKELKQ